MRDTTKKFLEAIKEGKTITHICTEMNLNQYMTGDDVTVFYPKAEKLVKIKFEDGFKIELTEDPMKYVGTKTISWSEAMEQSGMTSEELLQHINDTWEVVESDVREGS